MTIDRRTAILSAVIVVLLVAVAFLLGSRMTTNSGSGPFGMGAGMTGMDADGMGMHGDTAGAGNLSGSDVMFLQMMIPHHQQAVDMSDLALATSADDELLALAQGIRDGQAAEIVQMEAWLADAGVDADLGHSMGMGMGGMLSDSELRALEQASGTEFDTQWLEGMIQHHEGALHMIHMIEDSANPELAAFAVSIDAVQSAEIDQMTAMLERLAP
jgi:uncharacterized protein (DUF305 family)